MAVSTKKEKNSVGKQETVSQEPQKVESPQNPVIASFVNSLPQGVDAREVIKAIKEKNRATIVHDIVKEKFAQLGTMFNSGASISEVEPVARSFMNYLNEEKKLSGHTGQRGRKAKEKKPE